MPDNPEIQHDGFTVRIRHGQDYEHGLPEVSALIGGKPMEPGEARRHDITGCSLHRFVALDGEKVIGTATLVTHPKLIHGGCKAGQIEEVAVLEDWRGKGVGTALVEACKHLAKEKGCYKVQLQCDDNFVPFYMRCGLDAMGTRIMRWNND